MLTPINGATGVYRVLGDPVERVRAHESFNLILPRQASMRFEFLAICRQPPCGISSGPAFRPATSRECF